MPSAVVTVAEKSEPDEKKGKKRGRIKDRDGVIYQALPVILNQMHIGQTYQIIYRDEEWKDLKFRVIETVKSMMTADQPAPTHTVAFTPSYPPGAIVPVTSPAAVPASFSQAPAINRDELIFVEALIKPWMEKIPVGDQASVEHAINVLRGTFANTFGKMPKWKRPDMIETGIQPHKIQSSVDEEIPFNDEIPESMT